jgi:hypothetical protein
LPSATTNSTTAPLTGAPIRVRDAASCTGLPAGAAAGAETSRRSTPGTAGWSAAVAAPPARGAAAGTARVRVPGVHIQKYSFWRLQTLPDLQLKPCGERCSSTGRGRVSKRLRCRPHACKQCMLPDHGGDNEVAVANQRAGHVSSRARELHWRLGSAE